MEQQRNVALQALSDGADLVIHNAVVVTVNAQNTIYNRGTVVVRDGRIAAIGSDMSLRDVVSQHRFDAMGGILIPGLVNAHCHAAGSLFRGLVEDLPLEPWLERIWKAESAILDDETALLGSMLGFAELLLGGVTTVMDMHFFPLRAIEAAQHLSMRIATGVVACDNMPVGQSSLADIENFFDRAEASPHLRRGALAHGAYTVAPENIRSAFNAAVRHESFFHIHCAETAVERRTVESRYGKPVVTHLAELGVLASRTSLAHCVHIDEREIDMIAMSGASIVHNPVSNLKLGSGFAPIAELCKAGVNVALGTDGALSGNDLDMFLAMRLAATLPRAVSGDAAAVLSSDALRMGTINGACALGMERSIGSIEIGKQADFALVDVSGPSATPMINPVAQIVQGSNRRDVTDVFISGRRVVANGQIVSAECGPLLAKVAAMRERIVRSLAEPA